MAEMGYELSSIGNRTNAVALTEPEFREIATAKRNLVIAIGLEEKFYVLLENYVEFEEALLKLALQELVIDTRGWFESQDDILTVNRRLANLLSATRSYIDQTAHGLTDLFGKDSISAAEARKEENQQYDARLGYRAMDALRNYSQHRNFPIRGLSFSGRIEDPELPRLRTHTVIPLISVTELAQDGGVKPGVLEELASKGPIVAVTPLVRDYIEGLATVHMVVRSSLEVPADGWQQTVRAAMDRARSVCGESKYGFMAVAREAGVETEQVELFPALARRYEVLKRNGRKATALATCYVSSRVPDEDA